MFYSSTKEYIEKYLKYYKNGILKYFKFGKLIGIDYENQYYIVNVDGRDYYWKYIEYLNK